MMYPVHFRTTAVRIRSPSHYRILNKFIKKNFNMIINHNYFTIFKIKHTSWCRGVIYIFMKPT